jgi:hypothetical protein
MIPHKQSAIVRHTFFEGEECGEKCLWDNEIFLKKLLVKSNLHTFFLFYVVTCCCLLYNMVLARRDVDFNALM